MAQRRGRERTGGDRFRSIAAYVHATHVLLGVGTVLAPCVVLVVDPQRWAVALSAMLMATLVGVGASLLVVTEFTPHHRYVAWLRASWRRGLVGVAVLACALVLAVLVPDNGHPVTAASIALAWALRAVSGGPFWSGIVQLLVATVTSALVLLATSAALAHAWDPLTLVVAALLALGIMGQDSIYALAVEVDELRTREAERAIITERKRFAGDLHDIQGQHLGLITVESELVSRLIDRGDYAAAAAHAQRVQAITLEALEEMHRVVQANREVRLEDEIANAARVLRAAGIATQRDTSGMPVLDEDTDRLLGLTVREAITNVLKHTQASACSISSHHESRAGRAGICLLVTDSGPGAQHSATPSRRRRAGTGLAALRDRYQGMGGRLDFRFDVGGRLTAWLPTGRPTTRRDAQ